METIGPIVGENGWFQFYPPNDPAMEADMIRRAARAGYRTLVLTVDIPAPTRRERDIRNGMSVPPILDMRTLWQIATHPQWARHVLRHGIPDFENLSPYYPAGGSLRQSAQFVGRVMQGHIGRERFARLRDAWKGQLLVKGVLDVGEAAQYLSLGADGLIVSNHGGRQLDAAPTAVSVLPAMRRELGARGDHPGRRRRPLRPRRCENARARGELGADRSPLRLRERGDRRGRRAASHLYFESRAFRHHGAAWMQDSVGELPSFLYRGGQA